MNRILLITRRTGAHDGLREEFAAAGAEIDVHYCGEDIEADARLVAGAAAEARIVCDGAGERGCELAFFVCREAAGRVVILLAVGPEAEAEPLEVLAAAVRKAWPSLRVAVVTDRVDDAVRPSGGAKRVEAPEAALAEQIVRIAGDDSWRSGAVFRL